MFGFNFESASATIEVYIGNELVSSQHMQAPQFMLEQQYLSAVSQLAEDKSRPMSVKMIVPYEFYCQVDKKMKRLDNCVEYSNYEREYVD